MRMHDISDVLEQIKHYQGHAYLKDCDIISKDFAVLVRELLRGGKFSITFQNCRFYDCDIPPEEP